MNEIIYRWANMIVEAQEEPSYNDILILVKMFGDNGDTMTPQEYEQLSQNEKDEIFNHRKLVQSIDWNDKQTDTEILQTKVDAIFSTQKNKDDKNVYVHCIEWAFEHNNDPRWKDILKTAKTPDDLFKLDPGKCLVDNDDVNVFTDMESAKKYIKFRQEIIQKKFGISSEDFREVPQEKIPHQLTDIDPNAKCFVYSIFEAQYDNSDTISKRGVQTFYKHGDEVKTPRQWAQDLGIDYQLFKKQVNDGRLQGYTKVDANGELVDDELTIKSIQKDMRFSYWIYTAKRAVVRKNGMDLLAQALENFDLSWTERGEMTRKKKQAEKEYRDAYRTVKKIKNPEDELDNQQDNEENDTFEFDDGEETKTSSTDIDGNEIKMGDEAPDLDSDDEILRTVNDKKDKDNNNNDDDEKEEKDRDEQNRSGYDYGSQTDDEKDTQDTERMATGKIGGMRSSWDRSDREDAEIKRSNAEADKNTSYTLHGVPVSKSQMKKIQKLAETPEGRAKLPKNKEEVIAWKVKN